MNEFRYPLNNPLHNPKLLTFGKSQSLKLIIDSSSKIKINTSHFSNKTTFTSSTPDGPVVEPPTFPNLKVWGWRRPNLASRCSNVWRYKGSASPEAVVQYGTVGDKNAFGHIDPGAESETSSVYSIFVLVPGFPNPLGTVSIEDQALISPRASNIKANPVIETKDKPSLSEAPKSFSWTTQRMRPKRILGHCEHPEVMVEFFKNAKKNKHTSLQHPEQYLADQPVFLSVGADVKGTLSFTCQGKLLRYMNAAKRDPSFWSVVRLLYPNPNHDRTSWIQLSNTNR